MYVKDAAIFKTKLAILPLGVAKPVKQNANYSDTVLLRDHITSGILW